MIRELDLIKTPLKGSNLIEASAGTGKTFTIAGFYLRLIVESGFRVEEILVVTFTIAATEELRRRIRGKLKSAMDAIEGVDVDDSFLKEYLPVLKESANAKQKIVNALKSFDEASVYTIHSFCQQVLVDNAFESGSLYDIEIATGQNSLVRGLVLDFWRRKLYNSKDFIVRFFIRETNPEKLLKLYHSRPMDPSAIIEPQGVKPDIKKLENLYNRVESEFIRLKESWTCNAAEVIEILKTSTALNRNVYRIASTDSMVEKMNDYLKGTDPLPFPDVLEKFTITKIISSPGKSGIPPESPFFILCDAYYILVLELQAMLDNFLLYTEHELFEYVDKELERLKGEKQERSFDDLIKDVHRAVTGSRGAILGSNVSGRYRAALIDEFQDTDQLQFEIFSRLFGNKDSVLFLIGDPKQAIYRFRGADIFSYIEASEKMKNSYTLLNNWRSRPELIKAVNRLFAGCDAPFRFEKIKFMPVRAGDENQADVFYMNEKNNSGMDIVLAKGENSEDLLSSDAVDLILSGIAAKISEMVDPSSGTYRLGNKGINPGDIAVLVRTHALARGLCTRLGEINIPSVIQGVETVFSTQDALELFYIAAAVAEPGNERLVRTAVSTDMFGYKASDFIPLLNGQGTDRYKSFDDISDRFYRYRETWFKRGIMPMLNDLIAIELVEERLFALPEGERRITNIYHLIELLHRAEKSRELSMSELVIWFRAAIVEEPDDDEYLTRLERDDFAVKILTVHSSKGLEFPVVFCPLMPESNSINSDSLIYHDPDDSNRTVMYLNSSAAPEEIKELFKAENFAENVRLLYVAFTRAKSKCFVYTAKTIRNFNTSTPFSIFYNMRNDIDEKTDKPDFEEYKRALEHISGSSQGCINFQVVEKSEKGRYFVNKSESPNLEAKVFTGVIKDDWRVWSYSSLMQGHDYGERDRDSFTSSVPDTGEVVEDSIFTFPSGPKPGICIHEIFENIDFTWSDENLKETVGIILNKYGFEDKWLPHVKSMVVNVLNSDLNNNGLKLSLLDKTKRLNELEFYFPAKAPAVEELRNLFTSFNGYPPYAAAGIVDASSLRGFLKGFIDMIFVFNDRYYIIDWKSNNLGSGLKFYSKENIEIEMAGHNYYLQYHLYSLALHRYLFMRLGKDYDYEKDFGGVYYLFVRGMDSGLAGNGVFFDKPEISLIAGLDKFFKSGA